MDEPTAVAGPVQTYGARVVVTDQATNRKLRSLMRTLDRQVADHANLVDLGRHISLKVDEETGEVWVCAEVLLGPPK